MPAKSPSKRKPRPEGKPAAQRQQASKAKHPGKAKHTAKRKSKAKRSLARTERRPAQRLQRLLASAGLGSRRQCEELIQAGRVEVDGQVVTKLGTSVDPESNKVHVDGVLLKPNKLVYFAVNKPMGVVTTNRDPQGRPRVVDLVPPDERVFPVGRLDRNSEGLILLTNDGDLAQRLTHPKFGVRKVYRVTVAGKVDAETMNQMRRGIYLAEGQVRVDGARLLKSRSRSTEMEIVLREGKNREIRRILARLGHKVQHLRRIAVGPLRLGDLPAGAYRTVSASEVEKLWLATEDDSHHEPRSGSRRRGSKGTTGRGRKKSAQRKRSPADAQGDFSYQNSTRTGAVIGAESEAENPGRSGGRKPKRSAKPSAKRRATKSTSSGTSHTPAAKRGKPAAKSGKPAAKRGKPTAKRGKPGKRKRKG